MYKAYQKRRWRPQAVGNPGSGRLNFHATARNLPSKEAWIHDDLDERIIVNALIESSRLLPYKPTHRIVLSPKSLWHLSHVRRKVEFEGKPLPERVASFEFSLVLSSDLSKELKGFAVIHVGRIPIKMLPQELAT
jgi:hypothetical protein